MLVGRGSDIPPGFLIFRNYHLRKIYRYLLQQNPVWGFARIKKLYVTSVCDQLQLLPRVRANLDQLQNKTWHFLLHYKRREI